MKTITNITNIGDPFALKFEMVYYVYVTSHKDGFKVYTSSDLVNFDNGQVCYSKQANSFGSKDFWAPEVIYHGGKFVMHYTAWSESLRSRRIGVAISDAPTGPFIDVYQNEPMFDFGYAVIDATVLVDGDKNYMYYVRDCSENDVGETLRSDIYVAELSSDLTKVISDGTLVFYPTKAYEIINLTFGGKPFNWNEAPYCYKHNGTYYLMYSANFFESPRYCICVATSNNPITGFVKYGNPILEQIEGVISGPGHNNIVEHNGKLYCCYHIHTNMLKPTGDRTVCFSELYFDGDIMKIDFQKS